MLDLHLLFLGPEDRFPLDGQSIGKGIETFWIMYLTEVYISTKFEILCHVIIGEREMKDEAVNVLKMIHAPHELDRKIDALWQSVESEIAKEGSFAKENMFIKVKQAWSSMVVRRCFVAGIGVQVVKQFVGINTVMSSSYALPTRLHWHSPL